jgi:hypothetical protein
MANARDSSKRIIKAGRSMGHRSSLPISHSWYRRIVAAILNFVRQALRLGPRPSAEGHGDQSDAGRQCSDTGEFGQKPTKRKPRNKRAAKPATVREALALNRSDIGFMLTQLGFITADDLDSALVEQVNHPGPLGDILLKRGKITQTRLDLALDAQKSLKSKSRADQALGATKLAKLSTRSVYDASTTLIAKSRQTQGNIAAVVGATPQQHKKM